MNPVWIEFPEIPWGSAGWRMGWGEHYWKNWCTWYANLQEAERSEYKRQWPEAPGWEGFYDFIEVGATPPWALEERRKTEAAAERPKGFEKTIIEKYRVKWLLTNYLKKIRGIPGETGEYYERVLFEEPSGEKWLAYFLKPAGVRLERSDDA